MKGLNLDACMHAQFLPKQNWLDWLVSYYNFFIQSTKILFGFPLIAVKQKPLICSFISSLSEGLYNQNPRKPGLY
jgi:hypothetical protein